MLIDRRNWHEHRPWVVVTVLALLAAAAWYGAEGFRTGRWPGGGSGPGFAFGVAGGLIILFEMLLWWRKKVRTLRIGRVQGWMRAHIWLGLLCFPLLVLHGGFQLGGPLSTVLMALLTVVIASGVWGLWLQQVLPRRMLADLPAETIYSQIDHVVELSRREADRMVLATCGPVPGQVPPPQEEEAAAQTPAPFLTVGAVRSAGRVQGKVLETYTPRAPVPGSEPVRAFHVNTLDPYLSRGGRSGSPLRLANRSAAMFRDLRTQVDPAAHEAVDALERLADQRRQLDEQARLHRLLHGWLLVHLPLSVALVALMFVHVYFALRYW